MTVENLYSLSNYKELWGATVYLTVDKECTIILGDTPLMQTKQALDKEIAKLKDGNPNAYSRIYRFEVTRHTYTEVRV